MNVDLHGCQIMLKENKKINPDLPHLHFGPNLTLMEFDEALLSSGYPNIISRPEVVDKGTKMEPRKMYLRCPTGFLIEIKDYG